MIIYVLQSISHLLFQYSVSPLRLRSACLPPLNSRNGTSRRPRFRGSFNGTVNYNIVNIISDHGVEVFRFAFRGIVEGEQNGGGADFR